MTYRSSQYKNQHCSKTNTRERFFFQATEMHWAFDLLQPSHVDRRRLPPDVTPLARQGRRKYHSLLFAAHLTRPYHGVVVQFLHSLGCLSSFECVFFSSFFARKLLLASTPAVRGGGFLPEPPLSFHQPPPSQPPQPETLPPPSLPPVPPPAFLPPLSPPLLLSFLPPLLQ